jgi:glycosyltransferase 2 family protein
MTVSAVLPHLLRVGGWVLTGLAAFFLASVAWERRADIASIELGTAQWVALVVLGCVYGVVLLTLAVAWHLLLRGVGAETEDPRVAIHSFTASQLAKYIPGNVFHYVGRHLLLQRRGTPGRRIVTASGVEILLMVLCSLVVAATLWMLTTTGSAGGGPPAPVGWLGLVLSATALPLAAVLLRRKGVVDGPLLGPMALYLAFFVLLGLVFAGTARLITPSPLLPLAATGVAAWLAGFVTPGAPGGLGVREAALVLLGGSLLAPADLIAIGALFRGVTLLGDVVCAGIGEAVRRTHSPTEMPDR